MIASPEKVLQLYYERLNMSQKQILLVALSGGRELTSKQIRYQLGIASPTKVVSRIRMQEGFAVKSRKTVDSRGRVKNKFYIGSPSREVVAAGYRAMALGI
jgi:hypothetical protein